ncbi:hypothetical protein BC830DRAFT_1224164 [Chytriomyces sp. MP71]|nr:hypothetical protein BC830DRAFT_1224164 [Chytriomyces sp. MP71]
MSSGGAIKPLAKPPANEGATTTTGMTRREFRYSLFETLQENGIADKLKSQLRANIVAELKKKALFADVNHRGNASAGALTTRLVDSLIVDYLKRQGSEFTLSVFVPEAGLNVSGALLSESDVFRVLHLDVSTTLIQSYRTHVDNFPETTATIVKLLNSLSKVLDIPAHEKECQTDPDDAETVESELRRIDNSFWNTSHLSKRSLITTMESRITKFQEELELRTTTELETQLARFKEMELAKMRIEERARYSNEVAHLRGEYELKLVEQRERIMESEEGQRKWVEDREKELEKANVELRQRILEGSNRSILLESQLRSEAQISVKALTLENANLKQKIADTKTQMEELEAFKERYATKTQEAMAQYKIDLNREHAELLSNIQVEKARIESEKAVLIERSRIAERMLQQVEESKAEMDDLRNQVKTLRNLLQAANHEKEEAIFAARDLKLQVDSQSSATAVEFEIHSLKAQLIEAEKMGARRQEEYQTLLKSFMAPQNEIQKENAKLRKSEAAWQRECQDLVGKLDIELNRNEELQRRLEEEILKNKELKRDLSELRMILHRIQSTGEIQTAPGVRVGSEPRAFSRLDILPNPLDLMVPPARSHSPFRNVERRMPSTTLPLHRPGFDSPPRGMPYPTDNVAPGELAAAWDQGTRRMEEVAYRAGQGALGFFDNGERRSDGGKELPQVSLDMDSFAEEVLEKFPTEKPTGDMQPTFSLTGGGDSQVFSPLPIRSQQQEQQQQQQHQQQQQGDPVKQSGQQHQPAPNLIPQNRLELQKAQVVTTPEQVQQQPKERVPTVDEIRKSFQESLLAIRPASSSPPEENPRKGLSLKELMRQEEEEEQAVQIERHRMQHLYEQKRLDRERRDRELEELESERVKKTADEEARREKDMARLAGVRARQAEEKRRSSESTESGSHNASDTSSGNVSVRSLSNAKPKLRRAGASSSSSSKGNLKEEESDLKILNELEDDPVMQKYMAIVKEKREKEKSNPELAVTNSQERASKILSALENTSLSVASDKSGVIVSGDTIDDISAPSATEDLADDPW